MDEVVGCLGWWGFEGLVWDVLDFVLCDDTMVGMWLVYLARNGPTNEFAKLLKRYGKILSSTVSVTLFHTAAFNYQYDIAKMIFAQTPKHELWNGEWRDKFFIQFKVEQHLHLPISEEPCSVGDLQWIYAAFRSSPSLLLNHRAKFGNYYASQTCLSPYLVIQFIPFVTKENALTRILRDLDGRDADPRTVVTDRRGDTVIKQRTKSQLQKGNHPSLGTRYLAAMFDIVLVDCKKHNWTSVEHVSCIQCETCQETLAIQNGSGKLCGFNQCTRLGVYQTLCLECHYQSWFNRYGRLNHGTGPN
jgi:hypothetical protein